MFDYVIDYLGNQKQFLAQLATLWAQEWVPNVTDADIAQKIFKFQDRISTGKPPFVLVAFSGKKLLGSAALFEHDLAKRPDLSPWLAGVLVLPEYRGNGVARDMISEAVEKAKRLGYHRIYLHTEVAQGLYEKLGWIYLESTKNDLGEDTDIYYLDI